MTFHCRTLLFALACYLVILILLALLADKKKIPARLVKNPIIYVLAFGVSCGSWTYYGSVSMANDLQLGYLSFYIGISILLLFSAIVIRPLFNLAKNNQLSSLADLFVFRYRSKWVGLMTACGVLLASLPLLSLQIQAITDVISLLDSKAEPYFTGAVVCLLLLYTTLCLGSRDIKCQETHSGLVFALAIQSLFKLCIFLFLGYVALKHINGGVEILHNWLLLSNTNTQLLNSKLTPAYWFSLLLIFISAPLVLPHLFQLLFRESGNPGHLHIITWAAPLYLFLMALPVLPILWAGTRSGVSISPEYYTLSIGVIMESPLMVWLAYLGGLSAATGIIIFAVQSLANMLLNHAVLPFYNPNSNHNIYNRLLWTRRILICILFAFIFAAFLTFHNVKNQSILLMASYTGLLQLIPGVIGLLFWSKANCKGFVTGMITSLGIWLTMLFLPILQKSIDKQDNSFLTFIQIEPNWSWVILSSFTINTLIFIVISLITKTSTEEKNASKICIFSSIDRRQRIPLKAKKTSEFIDSLSKPLGPDMAKKEVNRALSQLQLDIREYRPYALRRLRDKIEANLSGIMGPSVSQAIISRYLPYEQESAIHHEDMHFLEQNLDSYHNQLSGMAVELDRLRRHHRDTINKLPIGVCSLTTDGEIVLWNEIMASLTGIQEKEAIGGNLEWLPGQWQQLLHPFANGTEEKITTEISKPNNPLSKRWFSLHRRKLGDASKGFNEGLIILLEDETEHKRLESELVHSERLASLGQLAAGIAHEIGNPITGIDCLAQDLKYTESPEDIEIIAQQIRNQTARITKIVQSLVNFSHGDNDAEHQPHILTNIVQEAIDLLALSRNDKQIVFVNEISAALCVLCEPQRLSQVFINLLGNAKDASPAGEKVVVTAAADHALETITITITDRGQGIKEEHLDHIFEPFFTTKEVGKGTGLGLFLSYSIVEEHYGHISVQSPAFLLEDIGTRFTIKLPLHAES